ncbi:hypothetical protein LTR91_001824 [Friedmanniomyces endolithicus]|uniref:Uncharacterized protein n=1 Tax=Friedmanniomyces endolithicus TaxID=329885 RepID=A0AAN6L0T3_9PEZI|nr:hypothetical protein LTR59_008191 [Friedmanniomyces endolithicus]KAK0795667.1 hypothetical protein LTR38_008770 [Friedmanniomyces endolithicus]KAK0806712.1 hypothetical protein LTR75_006843 [Friedmanniomyces endolithicus]KAK0826576.1 hypothetical protein LTR03_017144 [Friedmanniomyces endolithicus]KAK0841520.1 hypothetical protein LTS02_016822 [Friedmanniomyces endolithicus]
MMVRLSVGASLAGALLAILPQTLAQNGSFVCTGINAANNYNATISYLGCWTDTAVRTLNGLRKRLRLPRIQHQRRRIYDSVFLRYLHKFSSI